MSGQQQALLPTSDDKKSAQMLYQKKQVDKKIITKWTLIGVFIVSCLALSSWLLLWSNGFGHKTLSSHNGFYDLEDVFTNKNAQLFANRIQGNLQTGEGHHHNRSCDIFVETRTGLKESHDNVADYIKSKIDFDLNRYKGEADIDVKRLWRYFRKVLEVSNIQLKLDEQKDGSGNISPSEVYGYYKNFYPIKGILWTGYTKPEKTHDKLTGAVLYNKGVGKYYVFNNTASVNLQLKVPFQKKAVVISQQTTDVVSVDENYQPLKEGGTYKLDGSIFAKGVALYGNEAEQELQNSHDTVKHERPRVLFATEYKGFVYNKWVGFGFVGGGGGLIETPTGYFKEEIGTLNYGYCYDP